MTISVSAPEGDGPGAAGQSSPMATPAMIVPPIASFSIIPEFYCGKWLARPYRAPTSSGGSAVGLMIACLTIRRATKIRLNMVPAFERVTTGLIFVA